MVRKNFMHLYDLFKLDFYGKLYEREEDDSLTVSESFTLEVISSMEDATVKEVANFMKISQPNAAYKIANLEDKGYITKEQSKIDRRTYYLRTTKKVDSYKAFKNSYINLVIDRIEENFSQEDLKKLSQYFERIQDLMPEIEEFHK